MTEETTAAAVASAFTEETYKCVVSAPRGGEYRRIELARTGDKFLVERFTETQAFHETLSFNDALTYVQTLMEGDFANLVSWDSSDEHNIKISKKSKLFYSKRKAAKEAPKARESHDRKKNYIFGQGDIIPPLVDMGIFTQEGKVVSAMQDKYRQINRFVEIIDDEIKKTNKSELRIVDFGCGKSYLTFVLYHYFTAIRGLRVRMTGLDLKRDVIEKCNAAARKYGNDGLSFEVGDIGDYRPDGDIDVVISLHACDTATDFALMNAIKWNADMIFSVPCCQHELNAQIKSDSLSLLTRYGIVKERFAALLTDLIRANLLEYAGYKTQMVEFVAFDHTPKNVMLRAVKKNGRNKAKALAEVDATIAEFGVDPTLYRLMRDAGMLGSVSEKPYLELQTEALTLRTVMRGDIDEVARMWNFEQGEIPRDDARDAIDAMSENHAKNKHGFIFHLCLAVFERGSDKIIGWCGLDGTMEPDKLWIFFMIDGDYRRRGYATRCAKRLLEYAFDDAGLPAVDGSCDRSNIASYHVMEKSGMKRAGFDDAGGPMFRLDAETYRAMI